MDDRSLEHGGLPIPQEARCSWGVLDALEFDRTKGLLQWTIEHDGRAADQQQVPIEVLPPLDLAKTLLFITPFFTNQQAAEEWLATPGGEGACKSNETPADLIGTDRESLLWQEILRRAHRLPEYEFADVGT